MAYVDESGVTTLTNEIKNYIQTYFLDLHYPIGSIYLSVNSTSPATLFGGTWEQIQDKFLLAAGSTYIAGSTGGEAEHTHQYGLQYGGYYQHSILESNTNAGVLSYSSDNSISMGATTTVGSFSVTVPNYTSTATNTPNHYRTVGNTQYTSNMPPYLTVYMWRRAA